MTESINREKSKLHEMIVRGKHYREDFEFELYGEEVVAIIRPLVDKEFLPVAGMLAEKFDLDEKEEAVDEAIEKVEEAKEEGETDTVDVSEMDEEFVDIMHGVAVLGLEGTYDEEGNEVEIDKEEGREMVESLMGGYSVELASEILDVSGSVRDAEKFRGGRGSLS